MKEKKVYLIDLSLWDTGDNATDMSDTEWIAEAEFQHEQRNIGRSVYQLRAFEMAFNDKLIDYQNSLIRIL